MLIVHQLWADINLDPILRLIIIYTTNGLHYITRFKTANLHPIACDTQFGPVNAAGHTV